MKTVNSLSGGKTSSYLAYHYPADIEVFAIVCIEDHNAGGWLRRDKSLLQYANDKLAAFADRYGEFKATAEDPIIVKTMRDLEQKLGRNIVWVRGDSFETVMHKRKAVPNQAMRFCTSEMKIKPIFEYLYIQDVLPVDMRLGFRYDEPERALKANNVFSYVKSQNIATGRQKWAEMEYRTCSFPLIDDKIMHFHVVDFWNKNKDILFAEDSNCQMCFWKRPQQLRKNFDTNPAIMKWAGVQEVIFDRRLIKEKPLFSIAKDGLQMEFMFGGGSGCQADGYCTD